MSQSSSDIQLRIVLVLSILNAIGWFWTSCVVWSLPATLRSEIRQNVAIEESHEAAYSGSLDTPFDVGPSAQLSIPGISTPAMFHPNEVNLDGATNVIGVEVDGHSRAYVVDAFAIRGLTNPQDLAVHIVNDVIGDRPVSVAHCDLTRSTRVLTVAAPGVEEARPIDLRVGGWDDGMLLVVNGVRYRHHEPLLPLNDMEFTVTTWEQWLERHPASSVYVGGPPDS